MLNHDGWSPHCIEIWVVTCNLHLNNTRFFPLFRISICSYLFMSKKSIYYYQHVSFYLRSLNYICFKNGWQPTCIGEGPPIGGNPKGELDRPWGPPWTGECPGWIGLWAPSGLGRWCPKEFEGLREGMPERGRLGFDWEGGLGWGGPEGGGCGARTPSRFWRLWKKWKNSGH